MQVWIVGTGASLTSTSKQTGKTPGELPAGPGHPRPTQGQQNKTGQQAHKRKNKDAVTVVVLVLFLKNKNLF